MQLRSKSTPPTVRVPAWVDFTIDNSERKMQVLVSEYHIASRTQVRLKSPLLIWSLDRWICLIWWGNRLGLTSVLRNTRLFVREDFLEVTTPSSWHISMVQLLNGCIVAVEDGSTSLVVRSTSIGNGIWSYRRFFAIWLFVLLRNFQSGKGIYPTDCNLRIAGSSHECSSWIYS